MSRVSLDMLSAEILSAVFEYLKPRDHHALMQVEDSRGMIRRCAIPFFYRAIPFYFTKDSMKTLKTIAASPYGQYVRELVLRRRPYLIPIGSVEEFERIVIRFSGETELDLPTIKELYRSYCEDQAWPANICLAIAERMSETERSGSLDVQSCLDSFEESLQLLKGVVAFSQQRSRVAFKWVKYSIDANEFRSYEDKIIEDSQLAYALCYISGAAKLTRLRFDTAGLGFWTLSRLTFLIRDGHKTYTFEEDYERRFLELPEDVQKRFSAHYANLRDCFTNLTHLRCCIRGQRFSKRMPTSVCKLVTLSTKLHTLDLGFRDDAVVRIDDDWDITCDATQQLFHLLIEKDFWPLMRNMTLRVITSGEDLIKFLGAFQYKLRSLKICNSVLVYEDDNWPSIEKQL